MLILFPQLDDDKVAWQEVNRVNRMWMHVLITKKVAKTREHDHACTKMGRGLIKSSQINNRIAWELELVLRIDALDCLYNYLRIHRAVDQCATREQLAIYIWNLTIVRWTPYVCAGSDIIRNSMRIRKGLIVYWILWLNSKELCYIWFRFLWSKDTIWQLSAWCSDSCVSPLLFRDTSC